MSVHRRLALASALLAGVAAQSASAQSLIGGATVVRNDVRGDILGRKAKVNVGDRIFQDQSVTTAADSAAKFVFLDLTNMALGPQSQVKLDKFVYDGDGKAKTVSVTALKGAFRFISGQSAHEAYQVSTPQAVIGVRGTTYDVRIENGRTLVVLQDGAVNVCVRNTANCRALTEPGTSVSVTQTDIEGPLPATAKPWDFSSLCANGAAGDLCGHATQLATLTPLPAANAARQARRQAIASEPRPRRPRVARPIYDDDMPVYEPVYGRPIYAPPVYGPRIVAPPGIWYPRPGMRPPVIYPEGGRFPRGPAPAVRSSVDAPGLAIGRGGAMQHVPTTQRTPAMRTPATRMPGKFDGQRFGR